MKSYNWGIIGPGKIAHYFARDMKLASQPQNITSVLSHHKKSLNAFANKFKVEKRFLDLDDFVHNSKVDIAYIATPHPLHYEEIKACLKNKIAVLCEKPVTINHEQFEELQHLSGINQTFFMEGMWIRFLPDINKLLELISQKKIGDIISVKASMSFKAPQNKSNRYFNPEKGGGSLLDLGVYCVFLSIIILGIPNEIKAIGKISDKGIDEACAILLSHNNSYSILESSLYKKQNDPAEIFGTKGVIKLLDPWFEKSPAVEIKPYSGDKEKIPFKWKGHGLQFEIDEVVNCVSQQKIESELMPHSLSRTVLETLDKIRDQIGVSYPEYE